MRDQATKKFSNFIYGTLATLDSDICSVQWIELSPSKAGKNWKSSVNSASEDSTEPTEWVTIKFKFHIAKIFRQFRILLRYRIYQNVDF